MSYSIFQDTMADMNYQQIELAAEKKLPVLFPIAVIEEHGPHLCLGTDTYLTYQLCRYVKQGLLKHGMESLIVPPYYWGINVATNGFAGSFTVKPETMTAVMCDLLECLKTWGFDKIFLFNFHGDSKHNATILESARKAYEELGVGVHFIVPEFFLKRAGISGEKPYLLVQKDKPIPQGKNEKPPEFLDIHAGGFETSLMIKDFPDLVDIELAKTLQSSRTTGEGIRTWVQGGKKAREVTPLGYCGDPSQISMEAAIAFENEMAGDLPKVISDFLKRS